MREMSASPNKRHKSPPNTPQSPTTGPIPITVTGLKYRSHLNPLKYFYLFWNGAENLV